MGVPVAARVHGVDDRSAAGVLNGGWRDSRDGFCLTASSSPFQSDNVLEKKVNLYVLISVEMPMNVSGFERLVTGVSCLVAKVVGVNGS